MAILIWQPEVQPSSGGAESVCGKQVSRPILGRPNAAQVAWIRTGPGKFVRIEEGGIPAPPSTENLSASGSVAEEYGIAPSVFSLAPEPSDSVEGSVGILPGQCGESEIDTATAAEADGQLRSSSAGSQTRLWQPRVSRTRIVQVQRGIVRAISHSGRVSRQRVVRTGPHPRTLVGCWFAPNAPGQVAASRALGRVLHAHRSLRIRSPPGG